MIRITQLSVRMVALGAAMLALAVLSRPSPAAPTAPRLHVFVPTDVQPRALQRVLSKQLPGVDVVVFGRYKDFERSQKRQPPDVAISLRPVLVAMSITPQLQGIAENSDTEPYVLLSIEVGAATDLTGRIIGAVDLLGRRNMREFVGRLLSLNPAPKYKPVTKTDDLLPLLQFKSADVVLVPLRLVPQFRKRTKLPLETVTLAGLEVGLASAAAFTARGHDLLAKIRSLPRSVNTMMGVERWRAE